MVGFFDMLFWSRRFKRHMELKNSARMTGVPQFGVPDILVEEDEFDPDTKNNNRRRDPPPGAASSSSGAAGADEQQQQQRQQAQFDFLNVDSARSGHQRSWSGASADLSLHDTAYAHPLSFPISTGSGSGSSGNNLSPDSAAAGYHHRVSPSTFSFELQQPGGSGLGGQGGAGGSAEAPAAGRLDDSVSPAQVRDMLDHSVWGQSIRRSATVRRGDWASYGGLYRGP